MKKLIFVLVALTAAIVAATARAEAPIPDPPLAVWATADPSNHNPRVFGIILHAQSATDMPVPGVKVVVTTCANGQQRPFYLAHRTRHLDGAHEWLNIFNGGRSLAWNMFSAPANTAAPARLALALVAPQGVGGPSYCVAVSGYTEVSNSMTSVIELKWPLK